MKRTPKSVGMAAEDPRHGSTAGYLQGCKCPDCKAAIATYQRRRRKRKEMYGVGYSVDAIGSKRRIEALYALGYTSGDILAVAGFAHRNRLYQIREAMWVERRTAARIDKAFRALCMKVPTDTTTARRQQSYAKTRGWVPPLCWDNIDDPHEQPKGAAGFVRPRPRCGTDAGYSSHRKHGEPYCQKCTTAHTRRAQQERKAA